MKYSCKTLCLRYCFVEVRVFLLFSINDVKKSYQFRERRQSMHEPIAEFWVGLQISGENICVFWKKWVGPENVEEKIRHFWKKIVGGHQIAPGTNFRHTFRKYLPDPPL